MATAPLSIESRRAPRDIVSFRASIERADATRITALMVDISPFGFMSRSRATLAAGDVVGVCLPVLGIRPARVVWSLGGRIGGEFVDPIAAPVYARMLANAPHDRPNGHDF